MLLPSNCRQHRAFFHGLLRHIREYGIINLSRFRKRKKPFRSCNRKEGAEQIMAFLQIQFFSATLNVASTVNVIMPEPNQGIGVKTAKAPRLPKVLYLLH